MNTVRSPSRSNVSMTQAQSPPRRAKVTGKGQMDISSMSLTNSVRTTTNTGTYSVNYTQQQQQQQQSRPAVKVRSPGSIATISSLRNTTTPTSLLRDTTHGARINSGPSVINSSTRSNASNNSSGSNGVIRRVGTGGIVRASAGMVVGLGVGGVRGLQRDEGSVTSSDDGTVSEDSIEDHIQLFSGAGGNHINSMPFGVSSRHTSSTVSFSGSKKVPNSGTFGRTRVASSTVSSTSTASAAGKPRRMAAGASIRAETLIAPSSNAVPIPTLSLSASPSPQSSMVVTTGTGAAATGTVVGLLSTSASSSASSSSSQSWVSHNPSHRNDEANSTPGASGYSLQPSSMPHSSPSGPQQHSSHPTIRTSKPLTTSAAAASKLAEENRRTEEAARTRRKIADLEISNASLLQINQTLEATIRKQAAELQELKLRMISQFGGDLSLLPADLTTTLQDEDTLSTETTSTTATTTTTSTTTTLTTPETAIIIHEMTEADRQADLTFKRLCSTIEQMLFEAKQALDQSTKPTGVKVLSSFDMYEDDIDTGDQSTVLDDDDDDILSVDDDSFSDPVLNPSPAMVY
ncbi:hypothetical protein BGZ51_007124 [Haplosporangium sp. Z 767]|nr:hypothetical protein BGZ51_007124 [Haplosporangium sp. Z 767]KAF9192572.1 hypothetical protein BGZ50_008403 [Haplosporangium sp. Z 11]